MSTKKGSKTREATKTSQKTITPNRKNNNKGSSYLQQKSQSNQQSKSSNKITNKQRDLINLIVANILPDSESKKYTFTIAPEYKLCVTNMEGKKNFHYIRPTPKVLEQIPKPIQPSSENKKNKRTIQYQIQKVMEIKQDTNDHLKKILKVERLKRFPQDDLKQIVDITQQAFKFMFDPDQYGIETMRSLLSPHISISQMPIAKSPVGEQLIKDGVILTSLIQILASYSLDPIKYKEMAFDTMSKFSIETHYQQFWECADQVNSFTDHMLTRQLQKKFGDDSSESSSSDSESQSQQHYDYGGSTLSENWRPSKKKLSPMMRERRQPTKSQASSQKKVIIWKPYSQPVEKFLDEKFEEEPLGSCYTYKVEKTHQGQKILKQVRKSARIKEIMERDIQQKKQKLNTQKEIQVRENQSKGKSKQSSQINQIDKKLQKLTELQNKESQEKAEIKEWLKDHLQDVRVKDFINDDVELFQALTPQDQQIKRLFDLKTAKDSKNNAKNTQSQKSQSSQSSKVKSQISSSSSSLEEYIQSSNEVNEFEQPFSKSQKSESEQYSKMIQDQQMINEALQQQYEKMQQQQKLRRKSLQESARRQQQNINNARFINRKFNPQSPTKIIYEVEQQHRESSSRRPDISSMRGEDNGSDRGISTNKRQMKRVTTYIPNRDNFEEQQQELNTQQQLIQSSRNSRKITQYFKPMRQIQIPSMAQNQIFYKSQETQEIISTKDINHQEQKKQYTQNSFKKKNQRLDVTDQAHQDIGKISPSKNLRMKQIEHHKQMQQIQPSVQVSSEMKDSKNKSSTKNPTIFQPTPPVQIVSESSSKKNMMSSSKKSKSKLVSQEIKCPPPQIVQIEDEQHSNNKPMNEQLNVNSQFPKSNKVVFEQQTPISRTIDSFQSSYESHPQHRRIHLFQNTSPNSILRKKPNTPSSQESQTAIESDKSQDVKPFEVIQNNPMQEQSKKNEYHFKSIQKNSQQNDSNNIKNQASDSKNSQRKSIILSPFTQQSEEYESSKKQKLKNVSPVQEQKSQYNSERQQYLKKIEQMRQFGSKLKHGEEIKDNQEYQVYLSSQQSPKRYINEIEISQQWRKNNKEFKYNLEKNQRQSPKIINSTDAEPIVQGRRSSRAGNSTFIVTDTEIIETQEGKKQNLSNFRVEIHMIPERLICANLNGHNNYALVQLSKASIFELGCKYAFVPLRTGQRLTRKQVLQDQAQAAKILGTDDIGYIGMTVEIKSFIEQENRAKASKKSKEKTYSP